jgi:hypothetical protein
MPVKLRKQLTKTAGKTRLSGLPIKNYLTTVGGSESGATVAVTLVVVLAVIAGTAVVAQRSFDGLIGSRFQGRAKDARLTAEAATAYIISEWNRPPNRRLFQGFPMGDWNTSNLPLKNQCTAGPPDFDGEPADVDLTAVAFANGNPVTLGTEGGITRRFILRSAKFSNSDRTRTFTVTDSNPAGSGTPKPINSEDGLKSGFLELEVEGQLIRDGSILASITITREFTVEPKCCNRSFGQGNSSIGSIGNDTRSCIAGGTGIQPTRFSFITDETNTGGLTGGGNLSILDQKGDDIAYLSCIPKTSTPDRCTPETIGNKDFPNVPIDERIPEPPLLDINLLFIDPADRPPPLEPLTISNKSIEINPGKIDEKTPDEIKKGCWRGKLPGENTEALHCAVNNINLSGGGSDGHSITIDSGEVPVFLYFQGSQSSGIDTKGNSKIIHNKNGVLAGVKNFADFQVRGLRRDQLACASPSPDGQNFDMGANGISGFFLWAPCGNTKLAGTPEWEGVIWSNKLQLSGTPTLRSPEANSNKLCSDLPDSPICNLLEDIGVDTRKDGAIYQWSARSINFTRFF